MLVYDLVKTLIIEVLFRRVAFKLSKMIIASSYMRVEGRCLLHPFNTSLFSQLVRKKYIHIKEDEGLNKSNKMRGPFDSLEASTENTIIKKRAMYHLALI